MLLGIIHQVQMLLKNYVFEFFILINKLSEHVVSNLDMPQWPYAYFDPKSLFTGVAMETLYSEKLSQSTTRFFSIKIISMCCLII